ncbi:lipase 3 [Episyrphus balteatus]|uniref:lipase 3 n=1 Tax=Episyrphus balteatus TaxID=286459 RepID=UPI0024869F6E|nr:lipase 3 [Episyrphus balteatus]
MQMKILILPLPVLTSALLLLLLSHEVDSSFIGSEKIFSKGREIIITDAVKRIKRDGYPVEVHTVQTLDGYILKLHRIPYNGGERRPVVFLMTGIYASSDAWVLNGRENSLPYLLSNNGYDVWMGNNRGNIYTKKNVNFSPNDREFWNFSWHEMGVYDMPAMVDYILAITGQKTMHFGGVSQGATIFLVMNAMFPQYNEKFDTAHLLAPVAFVNHMKGPLAGIFAPVLGTRNYLSIMLEGVEMLSTNKFFKRLLSMGCLQDENPHVCASRIWPAVGYDTKHLNKTLIPDIMANFPVGGSFKQIMHYFQSYNSGKFRQYDYGPEKNKIVYNQTSPPDYQLDRVTVPTFIYFSVNDYIVSVRDIQRLVMHLPKVHALYRMPWDKWNHLDFICGQGVKEYIFDKVVDIVNAYTYYKEKRKDISYF